MQFSYQIQTALVSCRELDSDSEDNKSEHEEDPLADIPMTNFAEVDYVGTEVQTTERSLALTPYSASHARGAVFCSLL